MGDKYKEFCHRVQNTCSGKPGKILFGEGSQTASVAIVGFRPDDTPQDAEQKVFTGKQSTMIRTLVGELGAPPSLLWYTYVCKQAPKDEVVFLPEVKPWASYLFQELEIIRPRAILLLGVDVAWATLGRDETDIEELRRKRFMVQGLNYTNFFVTYSVLDVVRMGANVKAALQNDMRDIFAVRQNAFQTVILEKI